ncbi:MAG: hypothetical protein G01um101416_569 [Microgenomates group bacterium Gr01-1014_16]|nr:MAG: hypothetical protein G01um101416_569 [Microgenomates group bacterium Gr01-1014_16]
MSQHPETTITTQNGQELKAFVLATRVINGIVHALIHIGLPFPRLIPVDQLPESETK